MIIFHSNVDIQSMHSTRLAPNPHCIIPTSKPPDPESEPEPWLPELSVPSVDGLGLDELADVVVVTDDEAGDPALLVPMDGAVLLAAGDSGNSVFLFLSLFRVPPTAPPITTAMMTIAVKNMIILPFVVRQKGTAPVVEAP